MTVIAEMLGVPPADRARFTVWSNQRARLIEPTITARERKNANAAGQSLNAYFLPIIKARRAEPKDYIISALVHAEEGGDTLTEREMLNMLRLLLVAGNETTTNLIGNGTPALLRHSDQLRALRDDPGLFPAAVDELLRFDSPVQMVSSSQARSLSMLHRDARGLAGEMAIVRRLVADAPLDGIEGSDCTHRCTHMRF